MSESAKVVPLTKGKRRRSQRPDEPELRARVRDLHQRGVTSAYLYGDTPTANYSQLNSFYLLIDRPSVYGLPDDPVNPSIHMKGDYLRAIASGLAAIVALLAVLRL